jgi:hypothetical protein
MDEMKLEIKPKQESDKYFCNHWVSGLPSHGIIKILLVLIFTPKFFEALNWLGTNGLDAMESVDHIGLHI